MKDGAKEILGKTIKGVVIATATGPDRPASRLFLVFADGTYFEFYSDTNIRPTGGVDPGGLDKVKAYIRKTDEIVFETYPKFIC